MHLLSFDAQDVLGRSLEVRDEALAEKEKEIASLRMEGHTLDNYKYVLDHRVENMSSERGPVIKHVANLEAHIDDMYAEMVSEFEEKKVCGVCTLVLVVWVGGGGLRGWCMCVAVFSLENPPPPHTPAPPPRPVPSWGRPLQEYCRGRTQRLSPWSKRWRPSGVAFETETGPSRPSMPLLSPSSM